MHNHKDLMRNYLQIFFPSLKRQKKARKIQRVGETHFHKICCLIKTMAQIKCGKKLKFYTDESYRSINHTIL